MALSVYVAGKFEDKEEVRRIQKLVTDAGHSISHDWTIEDTTGLSEAEIPEYLTKCAFNDYEGVVTADALVLVNHPKANGAMSEMGMAIAQGIPVLVLNAEVRDNIFFHLDPVVFRVLSIKENELVSLLSELDESLASLACDDEDCEYCRT